MIKILRLVGGSVIFFSCPPSVPDVFGELLCPYFKSSDSSEVAHGSVPFLGLKMGM